MIAAAHIEHFRVLAEQKRTSDEADRRALVREIVSARVHNQLGAVGYPLEVAEDGSYHATIPGAKLQAVTIHLPQVVAPAQMSYEAAVACMNALNTGPHRGFRCDEDRRAFEAFSDAVNEKWEAQRQAARTARWRADRR